MENDYDNEICLTVCEFLDFSWKKTKQKSGTCWPISLKESLFTDTGRVHERLTVVVATCTNGHDLFISKVSSSNTVNNCITQAWVLKNQNINRFIIRPCENHTLSDLSKKRQHIFNLDILMRTLEEPLVVVYVLEH